MTAPRLTLAFLGAVATALLGEGVARLHGDAICVETPGAVYQADPRFGWGHVPNLSGWLERCTGQPELAVAVDANSSGLLDLERPYRKPPGAVRVLLLGGDLPEGLGVNSADRLPRLLEDLADLRRGARLEVINAGTGGFALDNDLLYLRSEGLRFEPDLVLAVVDPAVELAALSPRLLQAAGRPIPAKPFFTLAEGKLARAPLPGQPVAPKARPGLAANGGLLAHSQVFRIAARLPSRSGPPVAWIEAPAPLAAGLSGADAIEAEQARSIALARALLQALAETSRGAGSRFAVAVAPAREADTADEALLSSMARDQGIAAVELGPAFRSFSAASGRSGYFRGTPHWDRDGHFIAADAIWRFIMTEQLLPSSVVPARVLGAGKVSEMFTFPGELVGRVWHGRRALFSRFIQYGLLCVAVLWMGAFLPVAGRDWLLAGLSVAVVGLLGTPALALVTLLYALAFYAAVEALPARLAGAATITLLAALVVGPVYWPGRLPRYGAEVREYFALATNVALLRFAAYAYDRHRAGAARRPLREFLCAMFFFPTFVNGPIESAEEFARRRERGGPAPASFAALRSHLRAAGHALTRLAWGGCKVYTARLLLNNLNLDVFATGGLAVGHARLWVWAAELYANFYLIFSGWSDVSIALGAMAGSTVTENFRAPWAAPDAPDFWNRWHITFGRWLRTYVYIPLGGNRRHVTLNIFLVFIVSGLWHVWGALKLLGPSDYPPGAWSGFLLWGLVNATAVAVVHRWRRRRRVGAAAPTRVLSWGRAATFVVISLAWIPFFMPPWNRVDDCLGIFARLFLLR